ncbi:MAG: MBL fold metallo-hydrolase [Burkholderiales bacterium]|nr:MBL fold metallo-hydrolase [Burkholderiales bacterium]
MRFASLGSGSRGNALVVEYGRTRVMIDCGFTFAEALARLQRIGLAAEDIDAIVITHEHDDHAGGVAGFARRVGIPVYLTPGTLSALGRKFERVRYRCFDPHAPFHIGELGIEPFPVPHDAREPAQMVVDDGRQRLGLLTDVGVATAHIRAMLCGCTALMLECNHDAGLLREGPYPPALKARIGSRFGHMRNEDAAQLLASLDNSRLRHVVAAHLSETNNTPALARRALAAALGTDPTDILVANQEMGVGWIELV